MALLHATCLTSYWYTYLKLLFDTYGILNHIIHKLSPHRLKAERKKSSNGTQPCSSKALCRLKNRIAEQVNTKMNDRTHHSSKVISKKVSRELFNRTKLRIFRRFKSRILGDHKMFVWLVYFCYSVLILIMRFL